MVEDNNTTKEKRLEVVVGQPTMIEEVTKTSMEEVDHKVEEEGSLENASSATKLGTRVGNVLSPLKEHI